LLHLELEDGRSHGISLLQKARNLARSGINNGYGIQKADILFELGTALSKAPETQSEGNDAYKRSGRDPTNSEAWFDQAKIMEKLNIMDKAVSYYLRATNDEDCQNAEFGIQFQTCRALAKIYSKLNQWEDAINVLEQCAALSQNKIKQSEEIEKQLRAELEKHKSQREIEIMEMELKQSKVKQNYRGRIEDAEKNSQSLREDLKALQKKYDKKAETEDDGPQRSETDSKRSDLEQHCKSKIQEAEQKFRSRIQEVEQNEASLREELESTRVKLEKLQKQHDLLKRRGNGYESRINQARSKEEHMQKKLEAVQKQNESLKQNSNKSENELHTLQKEHDILKQNGDISKNELRALRKEHETLKENSKETESNLRKLQASQEDMLSMQLDEERKKNVKLKLYLRDTTINLGKVKKELVILKNFQKIKK